MSMPLATRPPLRVERLSITPNVVFALIIVTGMAALLLGRGNFIGTNDWMSVLALCLTGMSLLLFSVMLMYRAAPLRPLYDGRLYMAVSGAVYYAFGPLIYVFGSVAAVSYASSFMPVDAKQAFEITGLNFSGLGIAGLSYSGFRFRRLDHFTRNLAQRFKRFELNTVWVFFLLAGLPAQLLWVMPYHYGLLRVPSPGPVNMLANLVDLALLLGWYLVRRGRRRLFVPMLALTAMELFIALADFNKTELLLVIIMIILGNYLASPSKRALVLGAAGVITVYLVAIPVVNFGRDYLTRLGGDASTPAGFELRKDILSYYLTHGSQDLGGRNDFWWNRFNYLPSESGAIRFYQQGSGGHDYRLIPWIFVPRLLYPNKPSMTQSAIDLTYKINGTRTSSTGIGIFIDGYYNLGWFGMLAASIIYGFCLRLLSGIAKIVVEERAMLMLPLAFASIFMGIRTDGSVLADVLGATVLFMAALGLFWLGSRLFIPRLRHR